MLQPCPSCSREVSDQATSCPQCGHPFQSAPTQTDVSTEKASPIFVVMAALAFALLLFTPRILITLPMLATLGFAAVALMRKERGRIVAVLLVASAIGVYLSFDVTSSMTTTSNAGRETAYDVRKREEQLAASQAEIVKTNWTKDRDFGTNGTIKWSVQVKNNSNRYMSDVKVEFTTYDKSGSMVGTTFTYVKAIPPGGTRSESSYADLYGTEQNASTNVVSASFAN